VYGLVVIAVVGGGVGCFLWSCGGVIGCGTCVCTACCCSIAGMFRVMDVELAAPGWKCSGVGELSRKVFSSLVLFFLSFLCSFASLVLLDPGALGSECCL